MLFARDRSESAFQKIFTMATTAGIHNFELRMVEAKRSPSSTRPRGT
ncbi:hypothetical protein J2X03_003618 [Microbacterium trichothecenolyticum]|nr:hypothetical protein [Microbacterium trichothecenolyticum]MDR7113718.1 hypothetical protein [Microbacterium trichothecenolyticum]